MLALLYLVLAIYLGDQFSRRFFRYLSVAQRCATAVLVGLFLSSWFSYLAGRLFRRTAVPLLWSNLCFFIIAVAWIRIRRRHARRGTYTEAQFVLPPVP